MSNDTSLVVSPKTTISIIQDETSLTEPVIRKAMVSLIQSSVSSYGDVVSALLTDLATINDATKSFSWLSSTMSLLENEQVYRSAIAQVEWWNSFLKELPMPHLISETKVQELEAAKAERTRAVLFARSRALSDHQALMAQELVQPGLSREDRQRLRDIRDDPQEDEWRVDVNSYIQESLSGFPPLPVLAPITVEDLDFNKSFAGFNAARAMREHPELGFRAEAMDKGIAEILAKELGLKKSDALSHATVLTNIFWLALRRALEAGGNQLATSIYLLVDTQDKRIQKAFTEELLTSWLFYLENIPRKHKELTGKRGLLSGKQAQIANNEPKLLEGPQKSGFFNKIRGLIRR